MNQRPTLETMSSRLWTRLPLELMREILVILAMTSEREARQLRLVSSDINVLVLPLIYQHIIITKLEDIIRLTTTLLPKRKHYIPALKSRLHIIPRSLSTYQVESCSLVLNDRGPFIETALASIAPVFSGVSKLAITARNLQAHGYWLREHPIRPNTVMLLHYGSPALVNFYDPIFQNVTHLYTSITTGHRYSSVSDLPLLTHLAVSTRPYLPEQTAKNIAASLRLILNQCKRLRMLVLVMDFGNISDADWLHPLWQSWLEQCDTDNRFVLLPDYRPPRIEWDDMVNEDSSSSFVSMTPSSSQTELDTHRKFETLWGRALSWKNRSKNSMITWFADLEEREAWRAATKLKFEELEAAGFFTNYCGPEWEIDLVQRDNYQHPPASDPDLKLDGFQSAFG
ncbi:hypothetical protein CPB83DRAFT_849918 [Crepidotus variabilis]|uniref:Uncharacterized protein n=1 Tax=Crepidotus variabilis TaxID=179855 RepID=A0A9P6EJN1_9AGAR|nr:hypothetical protein CPB83DRAFT_849918 [Crepidotus variabilis]